MPNTGTLKEHECQTQECLNNMNVKHRNT